MPVRCDAGKRARGAVPRKAGAWARCPVLRKAGAWARRAVRRQPRVGAGRARVNGPARALHRARALAGTPVTPNVLLRIFPSTLTPPETPPEAICAPPLVGVVAPEPCRNVLLWTL